MRKNTRRLSLLTAAALAAVVPVVMLVSGAQGAERSEARTEPAEAGPGAPPAGTHWVGTWTAMPQLTEPGNMPPAPYTQDGTVLADSTLRQTVHVSVGGSHLRLRFSNAFGGAPLPITRVSVAMPVDGRAGVSAIRPGTSRPVTFHGRASTTVPTGAHVVSDPLDFTLPAGSNLTVTAYLATGQQSTDITSHPGSRTTSYLLRGDHVEATDLAGATPVDHWYFLNAVEVWSPARTRATAVLGDSLTDGRGSTTNHNDRWTDRLMTRLRTDRRTADTAVLNQAAGGNRVLHDGLGPGGLSRLDRDVLVQPGVTSLVVFEGVNDIGTAPATPDAQRDVADQLIAAYDQIVMRAHARGIRVYGATITPFGGNTPYDDAAGRREATRQRVNDWIRTSGRFDAVVDLDRAVRDTDDPRRLRPDLDVGDHLHFNPEGYRVLAEAFPLRLFLNRPLPPGFGYN
ncbi:SGNH/GDSL hydrolase family protein [Streptomyces sp. NPDC021354]|uniref:SGNH/GDSL hydrolase family protein n=2 Tax=Streptomyces TaxID=1883 RepID=A0ABU2X752_9ACTN|nr:SGNH/GDSL hydrolase family protein [Streptomyces sp. DSM 41529]MDT0541743.1 SGNH/GDSL hydrolase family protein [Streptomyces sp. DSM 41529]